MQHGSAFAQEAQSKPAPTLFAQVTEFLADQIDRGRGLSAAWFAR